MSGVILVRARILIRRRLAVSIRLRFVSAAASATIYRLAASSSSSCLSTTASIFKNKGLTVLSARTECNHCARCVAVPPQPPASGIVGSSSPVLSSLMANISNGIHVQNQVNDEDQCDKLLSVMSLKAAGTQPGSPLSNSTCPRQKDHSRHPSSVHSIIVNGMNGQWEDSVGVGKASWKPFLIGVAGGTASGKVRYPILSYIRFGGGWGEMVTVYPSTDRGEVGQLIQFGCVAFSESPPPSLFPPSAAQRNAWLA